MFDPSLFDTTLFDSSTPTGRILVNSVEMAGRVDLSTLTPLDSDITAIPTASFVIWDPAKTLTGAQVPRLYHEVQIYDDDNTTLLFGGFVNTLTELSDEPAGRAWRLDCQGYAIRGHETAAGSLNKLGMIDSDRNWVIAIWRDALASQAFGGTLVDDAIISANSPNWPGVQHTAFVSGHDWSYYTPANAMGLLMDFVPNVTWSIGPDKILTYGVPNTMAPFGVSYAPNGTTLRGLAGFQEETIIGDHKNKMRRGGLDTAEVTAVDEVSWSRFRRILDAGYSNDETIAASDLQRRAYAELRTKRVKRRAQFQVFDKGLKAGQLIDVVVHQGAGTRPAVMCHMDSLIARSTSGALAGERGRFQITKVRTRPLGNLQYAFDVEVGDVVRDFALQVSD